jgi:hypothetical protein
MPGILPGPAFAAFSYAIFTKKQFMRRKLPVRGTRLPASDLIFRTPKRKGSMMRIVLGAALTAGLLFASLPAQAQNYPGEYADLPGVHVTITKRSYLDPGTTVRPRDSNFYRLSPLYTSSSVNYHGIIGLAKPDPLYVPGRRIMPITVDYRAPAFLMRCARLA